MVYVQEEVKGGRTKKQSIGGSNSSDWSKAQLKRLEEALFGFGKGYFKDIRHEVGISV